MPNTLEDLREHLFETLKALKDKERPMDIGRAKAISEVASQVIESAKVEVEYVRVLGRDDLELPVFGKKDDQPKLPAGVSSITTHKLKG